MNNVSPQRLLPCLVICALAGFAGSVHAATTFIVSDYTAMRNLNPASVSAGDVITVTDEGIAGQFIARSGTITDDGGTLIEIGTGNIAASS